MVALKSQCWLCLPSAFALMSFLFCVRTRTGTKHDLIPISCLNEFPNAVQMAKVRCVLTSSLLMPHFSSYFHLRPPFTSFFTTSLLRFHLASLLSLVILPPNFCLKGLLSDNYKQCLHSHACSKLRHVIIRLLFPSLSLSLNSSCVRM